MPAVITASRAEVVISWLTGAGWDVQQESGWPLIAGPEIVDDPDQAVFITIVPGPGYTTEEGGTDAWAFQARVRGPSDSPDAPAVAAQELDWLILTTPYPASAAGVRILHAHRMGGNPVPLPLDPESRRFEMSCNYIIVTGA